MGFFEIRRVAKIRRPRELGRYFDRHEIWVAGWPPQETRGEVLLSIVGDEVIVRPVNLDCDRLLTVSMDRTSGDGERRTFFTNPRGL